MDSDWNRGTLLYAGNFGRAITLIVDLNASDAIIFKKKKNEENQMFEKCSCNSGIIEEAY